MCTGRYERLAGSLPGNGGRSLKAHQASIARYAHFGWEYSVGIHQGCVKKIYQVRVRTGSGPIIQKLRRA